MTSAANVPAGLGRGKSHSGGGGARTLFLSTVPTSLTRTGIANQSLSGSPTLTRGH